MDKNSINATYSFKRIELMASIELFEKFTNWIKGYFDLYLIDDSNILEVYFPNGKFTINCSSTQYNQHEMEIIVLSNSNISGKYITRKVDKIYRLLLQLQSTYNQ